jgi:hypothetical protein
MGWFDAPAGQANLLAGMSNIASHKIAEPNIGSAITSGLGKAVDAIKTRNDTMIKEEANKKVREILAQPMDAKNPMATQQLLAQWLPRADEKHQMIGKDAVANAYQGANYQTGQERLGLEKDRFTNQKEVSERDFKQRQLEHSDMIRHQKVLESNSAAQLGLSQKQYDMALESNKISLAQKDKELRSSGYEYDKKTGELKYNPETPEFKASKYAKFDEGIKSFLQLNSIEKLKDLQDSGDLFGGMATFNSTNNRSIGRAITLLQTPSLSEKDIEVKQAVQSLLSSGNYSGLNDLFDKKQ